MGEDSLDAGGYFIVNGTEKVMMMVEQTAANRIIILERDGALVASVTSDTHERKTKADIVLQHKRITLQHNTFGRTPVNICIFFKAMGCCSD